MAYTDFSFEDLKQKFSIKDKIDSLFTDIVPIQPSSWLKESLEMGLSIPLRT